MESSAEARAAALAARHHESRATSGPTLSDYAESSRIGDWSLRSALVRFAQPEPTRASAVLELVRRTDAALHPHRKLLESTAVPTTPGLDADDLDARAEGGEREHRVTDARTTDLARVIVRVPDGQAIVDAYAALEALDADELALVPVLAVAVELDQLAEVLAGWAEVRDTAPPADLVDEVNARAFQMLEAAGVPRETGPPPRRRGGGRR